MRGGRVRRLGCGAPGLGVVGCRLKGCRCAIFALTVQVNGRDREPRVELLPSVTLAVVPIRSAVMPAAPSCPDRAIEKQPAWAAAINSSGLVPLPSSKRVLKEYCVSARTPLSVEIVPLPS